MSNIINTPHISASISDFGKTVLMPGDPMRAKFIAENFLEEPILINNIRGVNGYTGKFHNTVVSVMASGMGMPAMGIYCYELFNFFNVQNIIRVGRAAAISENIQIGSIAIGMGACTNSNFGNVYGLPGTFAPIASYKLLRECTNIAESEKINYKVGNFLSSDNFYYDDNELPSQMQSVNLWKKMGVLAIEMETAALYMSAARYNKNALAICTISDNVATGVSLTSEERETTLVQMIRLALNLASNI